MRSTLLAVLTVAAAPAALAAPPPGTTCNVFPADNVWNTDISSLPVHPRSADWLNSMGASTTKLHPDFGGPYGIPYAVVPGTHPKVAVSFDYADESDPGPYPFGSDIPIEPGGDAHAIMIDKDTCTLYELYAASWNGGAPTAGSGAIFNLGSDALRPDGWTSADAAGLPVFAGLVRWDEVQAGAIDHAIRVTASRTDRSYLWPARHQAGAASDPTLPPMGARFRLKASFDLSSYSANAQTILRAMQHYGLIVADNGSNWYFQGATDSAWPDSLISELKTVPASAFEAVDESSLQVSADSGQARQSSTTPTPAAAPSPTSLSFGSQLVGTTSAARSVTLSSTGTAALTVSSVAASGDFAVASDGCGGATLAPGSTCTVTVTFKPTTTGTRTGTLTFSDGAGTQTTALSGSGTTAAPVASISPTTITFASLYVGTYSTAQTVTVRNTGGANLVFSSVALGGLNPTDFRISYQGCGAVIPGGKCTVNVKFTPKARGWRTAYLRFYDNAAGSPQRVTLGGTGL